MEKIKFEIKYEPLQEKNYNLIMECKSKADLLHESFIKIKNREMSLAITNLEQAVMWCTKAICINDSEEQKSQNVCDN